MILRPFEYVESKTIDDAVGALQSGGDNARVIAGGTALVPLMKHSVLRPERLVSIARIPGLADITPETSGSAYGRHRRRPPPSWPCPGP